VLLSTQYIRPRPPPCFIPREHLLQALDTARHRHLTLVSAGAGWGKTTLLASWAARQAGRAAWVSLDSSDNAPVRFWRVVITALRTCRASASTGELALRMLESSERSSTTTILTALLNDLAAQRTAREPLVLVLDDYHVIDDAGIHEGVAFLIEHLPEGLHLVVSGRS
jgi:LuxR family transcriptional regulator, maltose regulon positive regulatory protein